MTDVETDQERRHGQPGTRAVARYSRLSPYKARQVLDLIRGKQVDEADEILQLCPRDAATVVRKCLNSAVANATHNDGLDAAQLYVAACYANEGPTLNRWRPRARLRHGRIRKRTCHITITVGQLPDDDLQRWQQRRQRGEARVASTRDTSAARRARVARSRAQQAEQAAPADATSEAETQEQAQPSTETSPDDTEPQADEARAQDSTEGGSASGEEDE